MACQPGTCMSRWKQHRRLGGVHPIREALPAVALLEQSAGVGSGLVAVVEHPEAGFAHRGHHADDLRLGVESEPGSGVHDRGRVGDLVAGLVGDRQAAGGGRRVDQAAATSAGLRAGPEQPTAEHHQNGDAGGCDALPAHLRTPQHRGRGTFHTLVGVRHLDFPIRPDVPHETFRRGFRT